MALFHSGSFARNVTYPWYAPYFCFCSIGYRHFVVRVERPFGLLPERTQWIIVTYVFLVSCFPQIYGNYKPALAAFLIAAATCKLVYSAYVPVTRSGPFLSAFS